MQKVQADKRRRDKTLALILPAPDEEVMMGATCTSVKFRPSEKARLRELTAALNRRSDGRRIFTMSATIRYALDVMYVDIFDVSPDVLNARNQAKG